MKGWDHSFRLLTSVLSMIAGTAGNRTCFKCDRLTNPGCSTTTACLQGELCFAERVVMEGDSFVYNYGCLRHEECPAMNDLPAVGRRDLDRLNPRVVHACRKCCGTDSCNAHLCDENTAIPVSSDTYVRLIHIPNAFEGTVMVYNNGSWGTVCDDEWTNEDASVVCSMLGYSRGGAGARGEAYYGSGGGKIFLDEVHCFGTEASIGQCKHAPWGRTDCGHDEDAGVRCSSVTPVDDVIFLSGLGVGGVIVRMNLLTGSFSSLPMNPGYTYATIDYNPVDGRLYILDPQSLQVMTARFDGTDFRQLRQLVNGSMPEEIAVDPLAKRVFYTDRGLKTISSMALDGSEYKVVVSSGLDQPRDVVVDPRSQIIYWTDWGQQPKIERAKYDGSQRHIVVSTNLKWPNGLSIDFDTNRVYFTDGGTFRIESVNLDGSDRHLVLQDSNDTHLYGLDVFGPYIYYTDWNKTTLMRINKDGSGQTPVGAPAFGPLTNVKIHQYGRYLPGIKPAGSVEFDPSQISVRLNGRGLANEGTVEVYANGQWGAIGDDLWDDKDAAVICSMLGYSRAHAKAVFNSSFGAGDDLILLNKVNCTGIEIHILQCGISVDTWARNGGSTVHEAGVICSVADSDEHNLLLFSDSSSRLINRMDLTTFSYTAIPQANSPNPVAVAVRPADRTVFYSLAIPALSEVRSTNLEGNGTRVLLRLPAGSAVESIAVDGNTLFFVDTENRTIYSMTTNGTNLHPVINSGLEHPRAIVLDSAKRIIYWTDYGNTSVIGSANYDGTNRRNVLSTGLIYPVGLALDSAHNLLYFCDGGSHTIERVSTAGTGRTLLFKDMSSRFFDLALDSQYIYVSDWAKSGVIRINRDGTGHRMIGSPDFSRVNGLATYRPNKI